MPDPRQLLLFTAKPSLRTAVGIAATQASATVHATDDPAELVSALHGSGPVLIGADLLAEATDAVQTVPDKALASRANYRTALAITGYSREIGDLDRALGTQMVPYLPLEPAGDQVPRIAEWLADQIPGQKGETR